MDDSRDPDDLDLQRLDEPEDDLLEPELGGRGDATVIEVPRERFPWALAAAAALMLVAVGGLLYFVLRRPVAPTPSPAGGPSAERGGSETAPAPAAAPATASAVAAEEAGALPSLDDSDPLVRELVGRLSSHPELARWLGTEQLVRRFAVLATNVMAGESPRANLRFLEPRERLRVFTRGGQTLLDPTSYERFDAFVDAVDSLDVPDCVQAFRRLSPLFEAAFRELGHAEGGFDRALVAAAEPLLAVPVLEGDVRLRPVRRATLVYEYADPRLESLSLPQKQLLRMGPRSVRRLQAKLRALAGALDLPLVGAPSAAPSHRAPWTDRGRAAAAPID